MDFVRNAWYVAMWSQDMKQGELVGRTILNEPVVMFREPDGAVRALEDACPHRLAPLSLGKPAGGGKTIRCAYHGLEFNGAGRCVHNPHASGRIPKAAEVRAYPVAEKHSLVWIWMGDRAPDPAAIPDYSLLDGAHPVSKRDFMKMNANYHLVVDNLLDLSHTSFLHDGLLGTAETVKASTTMNIDGKTITVSRRIDNMPPPKFHDLLFQRDGARVDLWMNIRWDFPSCLINDTGATRPGAPRSEGSGVFGMHFITPETDATCWYYFAAVRQNPILRGEPIDSEVMRQITELRRYAFETQDRPMIEGQQKNMCGKAGKLRPFLPLETDLGTVRVRSILDLMIEEERRGSRTATG